MKTKCALAAALFKWALAECIILRSAVILFE